MQERGVCTDIKTQPGAQDPLLTAGDMANTMVVGPCPLYKQCCLKYLLQRGLHSCICAGSRPDEPWKCCAGCMTAAIANKQSCCHTCTRSSMAPLMPGSESSSRQISDSITSRRALLRSQPRMRTPSRWPTACHNSGFQSSMLQECLRVDRRRITRCDNNKVRPRYWFGKAPGVCWSLRVLRRTTLLHRCGD